MTSLISTRPALTSIKYRLAFLFFAITLGAILVIYFYVVPRLESNLTSQKLDVLERDSATYAKPFEKLIRSDVPRQQLDSLTRRIGEQTNSGVTLLGVPINERDPLDFSSTEPYVISDSREAATRLEPSRGNVLAAASSRSTTTNTRAENGRRLAQVAKPLFYEGRPYWVLVLSSPLNDVAENVALIRRQIVIAGLIALAVALVSGYYASSALSRRVKRLERAAGEVAAGNFSAPIPVDSEDELGQLARAFNEMQRKLAGLDKARKEFIANASHELRTPIFSLGGFVELLQDEEMDEATRTEFLATMREQVDRLQKLATDLLDLSRLDAGSLQLELQPVSLRSLAEDVVIEFPGAAPDHEIEVDADGSEVVADCDPQRVAQILRALVDNAITHTEEGTSIVISARAAEGDPLGARAALLTVTDNGPGIPRRELSNVFERFHTGDSGRGSGLGLAIARELAERMGGSLTASSRPGRTVFQLALPLARETTPDDGRPLAAGAAPTSPARR
jgi:signal transduction histidine kinase